jgi:WD40 repeat protein
VKFSADAKYVLSGSDDTNIRVWKAQASMPVGPVCIMLDPQPLDELHVTSCKLLLSVFFDTAKPSPKEQAQLRQQTQGPLQECSRDSTNFTVRAL